MFTIFRRKGSDANTLIVSQEAALSTSTLANLDRRIAAHILLNCQQMDALPLILCVVGSTGEGKSYNIKRYLQHYGADIYEISSAAMAHHKEGMALYPVIRAYRDASAASQKRLAAVLIDDFDRSIASDFAGRGHTIHSQLLTGLLMDLCDNPYSIPHEDTREMCVVRRVPVIITANKITGMDPALRRPQRMSVFHFELSKSDRQHLVEQVFLVDGAAAQSTLTRNDIVNMIAAFPDQPVAFFADVVSRFWSETAANILIGLNGQPIEPNFLRTRLLDEFRKFDGCAAMKLAEDEYSHRKKAEQAR